LFSLRLKLLFSPQYGLSVNVEDIDSSFTLGDSAQLYQQILEKLTAKRLVSKNKELPTTFDIQNIRMLAQNQINKANRMLELIRRISITLLNLN
jgi:hypothetical protein